MGAVWFRGTFQDNIVVVETYTTEARNDCERIGLSRVNDRPNLSGFRRRDGYLAPGLTIWYEKPDPAAIARRRQEQIRQQKAQQQAKQLAEVKQLAQQAAQLARQQAENLAKRRAEKLAQQQAAQLVKHRQQDTHDRHVLEERQCALTAAEEAVATQVTQRDECVADALATQQQTLAALLVHNNNTAVDLAAARDAVEHTRATRIADMECEAAALRTQAQVQAQTQAQRNQTMEASDAAHEVLAHALSAHDARLEALEAAIADHVDAESERRAANTHADEVEWRKRAQVRTHIRN